MIVIPTEYANKLRSERERNAIRVARSKYTYRPDSGPNPYKNKFICWDGEGPQDAGYALFGNSEGDEICHPYLSSRECIDLLLDASDKYPAAIHLWFGGNYDVSNILKDLPIRCHVALHKFTRCVWGEYQIQHIPHKWFEVQHGKRRIKVYDIHSYFGSSYTDALHEFNVGKPSEMGTIHAGKRSRGEFLWRDIDSIRNYWRTELSLMPELAEKLRTAFSDAGYMPRAWYGPGSIARLALRRHKIHDAMRESPPAVKLAALYAFAAGRFELFLAGHANRKIYIGDIHSAYPHFATRLPNLAHGKWRHARKFEPGTFSVWRIRYEAPSQGTKPYPLFRRMDNGEVAWPYRTTGWYWEPEASLVQDSKYAKFLEGWVFDESDPTDRPFAWLSEYYYRRLRLKRLGNAAEYTFKLIINSVYGQLAQRAGWDKKRDIPPTYHQIEWAGYITSSCRAAIYKVAVSCGDALVSIDTDGITSLRPFEGIDIGDGLGQWEVKEYDDGIFWQSGIYCLKTNLCTIKSCLNHGRNSVVCDHEWPSNKTRGIPKNSYSYKELLSCLASGKPLELVQNTFITYGQSLIGDYSRINTWERRLHIYRMGGQGKRIHLDSRCERICTRKDGLHSCVPLSLKYAPTLKNANSDSKMHYLPWMKHDKQIEDLKQMIDDQTILTDIDEEWEWMSAPLAQEHIQ